MGRLGRCGRVVSAPAEFHVGQRVRDKGGLLEGVITEIRVPANGARYAVIVFDGVSGLPHWRYFGEIELQP
jgi:hypothetical protein